MVFMISSAFLNSTGIVAAAAAFDNKGLLRSRSFSRRLLTDIGPLNSTVSLPRRPPRTKATGGVHRVIALIISEGSGHRRFREVGASVRSLQLEDEGRDIGVGARFLVPCSGGRGFVGMLRICFDVCCNGGAP